MGNSTTTLVSWSDAQALIKETDVKLDTYPIIDRYIRLGLKIPDNLQRQSEKNENEEKDKNENENGSKNDENLLNKTLQELSKDAIINLFNLHGVLYPSEEDIKTNKLNMSRDNEIEMLLIFSHPDFWRTHYDIFLKYCYC